jgi:hypothetical protein
LGHPYFWRDLLSDDLEFNMTFGTKKKWSFKTDDLLKEVNAYKIVCDRTRKE